MRILVNLERKMALAGLGEGELAAAASIDAARVAALIGGATATGAEASAINRALNVSRRKRPAAGVAQAAGVKRRPIVDHLSSIVIRKRTRHGVKRPLDVPKK